MSGDIKLRWKMNGFRGVRTDPRAVAELERRAQLIADAASVGLVIKNTDDPRPRGFLVDSQVTSGRTGRARASVRTVGIEAMEHEGRNRALTRAFDAGRG